MYLKCGVQSVFLILSFPHYLIEWVKVTVGPSIHPVCWHSVYSGEGAERQQGLPEAGRLADRTDTEY